MARGKHEKPSNVKRTVAGAALVAGGGALIPLVASAPASAATMSQWDHTAQLEAGGDWSINHSSDGRSVGGLQFQTPSWSDALNYLSSHGFDVSCYNRNLHQGMPRSAVPSKDQTILAGEALLAIQGPGAWANGNFSGGSSMFHGGPNPWGLGGTSIPSDASCNGSSPAPAPVPADNSGTPVTTTTPAPPPVSAGDGEDGDGPWRPPALPVPVESASTHYTVQRGDCLFKISKTHYGDGAKWTRIYEANRALIGSNPNLIEIGQVLVLP